MVDLFAGCGGLSAGLESTGAFRSVAAVELDAEAAATYSLNFGDHVFVGDIADWLKGALPAADVVVGGPPCQGFSQLGLQDPDDPRNILWGLYVEAIERIRPQYFVIENVPQFFKSGQFKQFTDEFDASGRLSDYRFEAQILNAADYGAAQNRRRAVIIASPRDQVPVRMEDPIGRPATVTDAWSMLPVKTVLVDLPMYSTVVSGRNVAGPFTLKDLHVTRRPTPLSVARYEAIPVGGNRHDLPDHLKAPCWRRHSTGAGDVMGRLHADRPSVTIRTEFFKPEKGRYLHPTENRPITHAEAARIQGFDPSFQWCGSKSSIARQIGNAVPPPLAAAIGRAIRAHHLR